MDISSWLLRGLLEKGIPYVNKAETNFYHHHSDTQDYFSDFNNLMNTSEGQF